MPRRRRRGLPPMLLTTIALEPRAVALDELPRHFVHSTDIYAIADQRTSVGPCRGAIYDADWFLSSCRTPSAFASGRTHSGSCAHRSSPT